MSHVTVSINGRQVRLACSEGEEAHFTRLVGDFDKLIGELCEHHGELGDARLTLMAALTVADDLAEARSKLQKLEAEVAAMQEARAASAERSNVRSCR
jgi:cell division protein ZapA